MALSCSQNGRPPMSLQRARALRQSMTDAERKLWRALRNRQTADLKFKRQVPLGPYIADFLCFEAQLIVEADGSQHSAQEAYDQRRTAFLEGLGYKVLRFWNYDILTNLDGVLIAVVDEARGRVIRNLD